MVYRKAINREQNLFSHRNLLVMAGAVALLVLVLLGTGNFNQAAVNQPKQSFIVQGASLDEVKSLVEANSGEITSELEIINGVGAMLTESDAERLEAIDGVSVTPNYSVVSIQSIDDDNDEEKEEKRTWDPSADYTEVTGADDVWAMDVTGDGIGVAILDTGIDPELPGLALNTDGEERIILRKKANFIDENSKPYDKHGHGSHIASIIASSETEADGDYMGMAPDVDILPVKVLDDSGAGTYESVILGIQYTVKKRKKFNIKVMNMSLVSPVQSPYWADPLNQAVTAAWSKGIVVVVAAGNSGSEAMSITVPGNNPYVITVGAYTDNFTPMNDSDDYITPFSSAGPTLDGFVKPDVVAPGAHIYAAMGSNTVLAEEYPDSFHDPSYFTVAGTSQATAVTSGIVALMMQYNSEARADYKMEIADWKEAKAGGEDVGRRPARVRKLNPDRAKFRLMESAEVWVDENNEPLYSIWQQGFGRVNAPDAVFNNSKQKANAGMQIKKDLAGEINYEGYSFYDEETEMFYLYEDPTNGGFGSWAGGFGSWAGAYTAWDGEFTAETGGFGSWAGGFGSWAGGFGSWAGGFGSWAGGFGSWAGGFGSWAGGFGSWAGGFGSWAGVYGDADFAADFVAGTPPDASTSAASNGSYMDFTD